MERRTATGMSPQCFNEAGAFAPEILGKGGRKGGFLRSFNEAGAFAPEIFPCRVNWTPQMRLASMRPGLLPRRYCEWICVAHGGFAGLQ